MEKKNPKVNIAYLYGKYKFPRKLIENIFSYVLKKEKKRACCVIDVAFTNNKQIQMLNKKYRRKNKPTDVLSFYMMDDTPLQGERRSPLLGEIIISVPYARRQAKQRKNTLAREIIFLLIHGLLHLLGYDDETQKAYEIMMKKQKKYWGQTLKRD